MALLLGTLVGLAACAPQPPAAGFAAPAPALGAAPLPVQPERAKVALLLPLTGSNAPLGQALLNAAQLALFEQGAPGFEFNPRDTGGTASGAAEAARAATADGARVIVGPLTAQETAAAAVPARAAGVPMLPFTNDGTQAAPLVWPLGLTPAQQVRRLVGAAHAQGITRFALAAPDGAFGRQLSASLRAAASELGVPQPAIETYPAAASPNTMGQEVAQKLGLADAASTTRPELLILGESGQRARDFATGLTGAMGSNASALKLAGHAQWASDEAVAQEPALAGAWYPGADPAARSQFDSRYEAAFGEKPSRIVGVAYDAAAIAARAVRNQPAGLPQMPVGEVVLGADGALRLNPNGQVQRALAVFALTPGVPGAVVSAAELPGGVGF
jgi:ABC-type branched-subunit amino acid transport system substrate-binding protein